MADEALLNAEDNTDGVDVKNESLLNGKDEEGAVNDDGVEKKETDGAAEGKDSEADESKSEEGAPDEYAAFTMPDGMELDEEVGKEFATVAKELNLTQEKAQALIDLQTKVATRSAEAMAKQWETLQNDWKKASTEDKEFGGKELKANLAVAKKALDKFGSDELKKAIDMTGMGNHPELIRFLYKIGQTLKEDGIMNDGSQSQDKPDLAHRFYPTMN